MLTTNPSVLSFFSGRPVDYSQLVPHIELYKVYIHDNKKETEEYPFPFKSFQDFNNDWPSVAGGALVRGRDAGIQSINLKMEGRQRNPVSANVMDITIKFFFNDSVTLFRPFGNLKNGSPMSFSDLIRYPPSLRKNHRSFRIRLVLGWSMFGDSESYIMQQEGGESFKAAVDSSRISITADLYTHNMEFDNNGSMIITAKYKGALESAFSSNSANILHNVGKDTDFIEVNKKIAENENKLLTAKYGAGATLIKSGENFLKEAEKLDELRRKLKKAREDSKEPFPEDIMIKQYNAVNAAAGNFNKLYPKGKTPVQQLKDASKGQKINELLNKSDVERQNIKDAKAAIKRARRGETPKSKQTEVRALKKAINKLKKEKKTYAAAMRGKYLFSYVEELRIKNRLAYIMTGRKSKFGSYVDLMTTIEEKGGTEKGARTIEKKAKKVLSQQKKPEPDLLNYKLTVPGYEDKKFSSFSLVDDMEFGFDILEETKRTAAMLGLDPSTVVEDNFDAMVDVAFAKSKLSDKAKAKIEQSGKVKKKTKRRSKKRQRYWRAMGF